MSIPIWKNLKERKSSMRSLIILIFAVLIAVGAFIPSADAANGRKITVKTTENAQAAYDAGFAKQVMREGDGAVKLWNRQLIEDDSPGAGTSNKGAFLEPVWGDRAIKKLLTIEDPRCEEAFVVFYTQGGNPKMPPVVISVNGNETKFLYQAGGESYAYAPIKPSWLKKGDNEIVFSCPDAKDQKSGYMFYISRADEYKPGGADLAALGMQPKSVSDGISLITKGRDEINAYAIPKGIGNHSMISTNGGKTWAIGGKGLVPNLAPDFGTEEKIEKGGVVGEYTARLNLKRYTTEGTLISPVIDLWAEPDKPSAVTPFTEVERLAITFKGSAPAGTQIVWQLRAGLSMDPYRSEDWSDWVTLATGASATVAPKGRVPMPPTHWDPERSVTLPKLRYFQWRAVLSTTDPLKSPTVESVTLDRDITRRMEIPANWAITAYNNPVIRYSSTGFIYQSADEPMNKAAIDLDDLDKLAAGAGSEFDIFVRFLDYSSRRWVYGSPLIEYPKWNTIDTAERAQSLGNGGMCIQFAAYLAHMLTVMGFHARHVNIQYHEVTEVWSDDFQKWIYLDPTQGVDMYLYDKQTKIPLSLYDIHRQYYELYNIKTPIDWMANPDSRRKPVMPVKDFPASWSTTDPRVELSHVDFGGYWTLLEFLRMMPRNDFSTTTTPEPLQQGCMQWPWDGYLNWYDSLCPPKLQYSKYTDRECDFWPTLNQVRFEAVPEINGNLVYITMTTFTPSFKTFQVKVDEGAWTDSDDKFVWNLHSGKNRLEMRAVSKFGVKGSPSFIDLNWVSKIIPKGVNFGSME
jgi:hypothetical protein